MTTLQNKTALVTGASRGIGRATAAALAGAGAHVLVHYGRSAQEAESLVAEIQTKGGQADAISADLGSPDGASLLAKQVRAILDQAKERLANSGQRTVLFIDEIHRFNRAQQDILLPDVENGLIILIGATTENPFFAVNSPLVSRSQIFQFSPISEEDIRKLVDRAIHDPERGYACRYAFQRDDACLPWA